MVNTDGEMLWGGPMNQKPCPACGYCPCCGRQAAPVVPYVPVYPQPYYPPPVMPWQPPWYPFNPWGTTITVTAATLDVSGPPVATTTLTIQ